MLKNNTMYGPHNPKGCVGHVFTSTTQPKVGLCVLYLRPGPLRGQATLKENSTTRRVVLLQMRRNKHSTQAHTATHNPPKGGLCVLTANHLTVVGLHQNKNSEVLRRNKHRTAATTCNKYKLLLQHTSNTIANNTTQPKGLGCVFYINSLTGIDAGIK